MTKILFDSRNWWSDLQSDLHRYFDQNPHLGVQCLSVFHNAKEAKNYPDINKDILTRYWKICKDDYDEESIIELEAKYNTINLWNVIYSDRFLNGEVRHEKMGGIIKYVSFYFSAWEKVIENFKPDYIVSETITGLWNYSLFSVAKANNIVYLGLLPAKNSDNFYYSRDIWGRFLEFEKKYDELKNEEITDTQLAEAKNFLKKFLKDRNQPAYMSKVTRADSYWEILNPYRIVRNIMVATKYHFNALNRNDHKSTRYPFEIKARLLKRFRRDLAKGLKIFDEVSESEKFILFPLHFQPEASTGFWAPYYKDQLYVIRQLARSLPYGYKLYVKEHSANYGTKSLSFYKLIKQLPNVRLISPFYNIYELIEKSSTVAVITSTTGLEAILLNKPVIIFGRSLFDFYPYINKVENISNLPQIIKKSIEEKTDENDELRLKFIYAYINSGYKGDYFKLQRHTEDEITIFAQNLCNEINIPFNIKS